MHSTHFQHLQDTKLCSIPPRPNKGETKLWPCSSYSDGGCTDSGSTYINSLLYYFYIINVVGYGASHR